MANEEYIDINHDLIISISDIAAVHKLMKYENRDKNTELYNYRILLKSGKEIEIMADLHFFECINQKLVKR